MSLRFASLRFLFIHLTWFIRRFLWCYWNSYLRCWLEINKRNWFKVALQISPTTLKSKGNIISIRKETPSNPVLLFTAIYRNLPQSTAIYRNLPQSTAIYTESTAIYTLSVSFGSTSAYQLRSAHSEMLVHRRDFTDFIKF